jgi:hypothetical protein
MMLCGLTISRDADGCPDLCAEEAVACDRRLREPRCAPHTNEQLALTDYGWAGTGVAPIAFTTIAHGPTFGEPTSIGGMVDIKVTQVRVPRWSSVGYGWGTNELNGEDVVFLGDHRPMRALGEAVSSGEPISVSIGAAQILR